MSTYHKAGSYELKSDLQRVKEKIERYEAELQHDDLRDWEVGFYERQLLILRERRDHIEWVMRERKIIA